MFRTIGRTVHWLIERSEHATKGSCPKGAGSHTRAWRWSIGVDALLIFAFFGIGSEAAASSLPTFGYGKLYSSVMPGDLIGFAEESWFKFCTDKHPMKASDAIEIVFDSEGRQAFKKVATAIGLSVAAVRSGVEPIPGMDYLVGGVINSMHVNACTDAPDKLKGSYEFDVTWELFSKSENRVVFSRTTTGSFSSGTFATMSVRAAEVGGLSESLKVFLSDGEARRIINGGVPRPPDRTPAILHVDGTFSMPWTAVPGGLLLPNALVEISSDSGPGFGFYLADGYVLTVRRLVGNERHVKIRLPTGRVMIGTMVRSDAAGSVALLKTDSAGLPSLRVQASVVRAGADVWALTTVSRREPSMSRGRSAALQSTDSGRNSLRMDTAIPSVAGGPVFDAKGELIGISEGMNSGIAPFGTFIPINAVIEQLAVSIDNTPRRRGSELPE